MLAVAEKRALSFDDLEAQTALELPVRETPVTIVIGCLAVCVGQIRIQNVNVTVEVANQICAAVTALNVGVLSVVGTALSCDVRTRS